MTRREATTRLTRTLKDFLIGLGVFALMVVVASADSSGDPWSVLAEVASVGEVASSETAEPSGITDAALARSQPIYRGTHRGTAMLILALVFASIVAFNLGFFRHLRRVYASSRRRG